MISACLHRCFIVQGLSLQCDATFSSLTKNYQHLLRMLFAVRWLAVGLKEPQPYVISFILKPAGSSIMKYTKSHLVGPVFER